MIAATLSLCCLLAPQTAPAEAAPAQAAATAPATDTRESLVAAYALLNNYLKSKRVMDADAYKEIDRLRKRARAFNEANPGVEAVVAMELQLAIYRQDHDRVEPLFQQLGELRGNDEKFRVTYAEHLRSTNQYQKALDLLTNEPVIGDGVYRATLIEISCLVATNSFDAAQRRLDALDDSTVTDPALQAGFARLRRVVPELQQLWTRELEFRRAEQEADDLPRVSLTTPRGEIVLELFENHAPETVANFVALTEKGFYDGTTFHAMVPNLHALGGDPNTKEGATGAPGKGGPGYFIPDEFIRPDRRDHFAGTIAMHTNGTPNTAGSQFAIMIEPNAARNGRFTAFGRIIEGMDVLCNLRTGDVVSKATVVRKRDHEYVPATLPDSSAATLPASPATGADAKD